MSYPKNAARRILPYANLRKLPKSKESAVTGFSALYSVEQCFLVTSSSWAINPGNCPTISHNLHRWNQRTDTLWWSAIATTKLAPKRVVRSWAARRLRVAFVESLKKYGYFSDGSQRNRKNGSALKGTLQLFANHPILISILSRDLTMHMDHTVQLIINQQQELKRSGEFAGKKSPGQWKSIIKRKY